jgi:hypothetical protein
MKAKQIVLASLIAVAGTAFADDITIDTKPLASTRNRAEVKAEVRRALAAGEHFVVGEGYGYMEPVSKGSTVTRAEVKAELAAALAAGQVVVGEYDPRVVEPFVSVRSRDEVKAEFLAARAAGELIPDGEAYYVAVAQNPKAGTKASPSFLARRRTSNVAQ